MNINPPYELNATVALFSFNATEELPTADDVLDFCLDECNDIDGCNGLRFSESNATCDECVNDFECQLVDTEKGPVFLIEGNPFGETVVRTSTYYKGRENPFPDFPACDVPSADEGLGKQNL